MHVRVQTTLGDLEGLDNRYHQAFLGVPFAWPPTQQYRFAAPSEPQLRGWPSIRAIWRADSTRRSSC